VNSYGNDQSSEGIVTTFGERLRTLRRAAGLSQTELAGDGLSPSYISLLESDRRRPSPAVAAQLAAQLGCSTSQLLEGEPSERERRVQLEIAYAELALRHEGAADAVVRLQGLLEEPELLPGDRADAGLLLATAYERTGELPAAVATLLPIFERACAGEGPVSVTRVGTHLCFCYAEAGDLHRAVTVGERALEACRAQGLEQTDEYFMIAATVMGAYSDMGDDLHATVWAQQLTADAENAGNRRGVAGLYWNAAVIAEQGGRIDEALHLTRRALAHLGELGESRDLARLKLASAEVLLAADPPRRDEARETLDQDEEVLRRRGGELDIVTWEHLRSTVALLDGEVALAEALARAAVERVPHEAGSDPLSLAHQALGDALAAQSRHGEAVEHYEIAADLRSMGNGGRASALAWRDIAERLWAEGEQSAAVRAYRAALDAAGVRDRVGAVLAAVSEGAERAGVEGRGGTTEVSAAGIADF
jgi:transcriptional regulator with XRE-family HTH domain